MKNMVFDSFVICTSPRSGSTLLCKLLSATGVAGCPDSHFHRPSLSAWLQTFGLRRSAFLTERAALAAIFAAAFTRGSGDTGVFGLRLQRGSFDFFQQKLFQLYPDVQTDAARIKAAFGQTLYIHLTRENKLQQAISSVKAQQSGLWHRAADGSELERTAPARAPFYDAAMIAAQKLEFEAFDLEWEKWFARQNLNPLRISYEALAEDPGNVLGKTLENLGLDPNFAQGIQIPTAKLSDEHNLEWQERFRHENPAI